MNNRLFWTVARNLRLSMPPLVLVIAYAVVIIVAATLGLRELIDFEAMASLLITLLIAVLAFAMGIARVVLRHPAFSAEYYEWLSAMPWNPAKPLPLGPLHLEWRDAPPLIIGVLFTAWLSVDFATLALAGYLAGYVTVAAGSAWQFGYRRFTYEVLFAIELAICFVPVWPLVLATAVGIVLIAMRALSVPLKDFPWYRVPPPAFGNQNLQFVSLVAKREQSDPVGSGVFDVGWPWHRLTKPSIASQIPFLDAVLLGIAGGGLAYLLGRWILHADLGSEHDIPSQRVLAVLVCFPIIVGALIRILRVPCSRPISSAPASA